MSAATAIACGIIVGTVLAKVQRWYSTYRSRSRGGGDTATILVENGSRGTICTYGGGGGGSKTTTKNEQSP